MSKYDEKYRVLQFKRLDQSIEHWKEIVYQGVEEDADGCACCGEWNYEDLEEDEVGCVGCPIRLITGESYCTGTLIMTLEIFR